jgi:hypothetical protein
MPDQANASWRDRAACQGQDPAWWVIADGRDMQWLRDNATAMRICASCPVRAECWADAEAHEDIGVIRGGRACPQYTGGWRRDVRRVRSERRARKPPTITTRCGTRGGYRDHTTRSERACGECQVARLLATADREVAHAR